jgi:GTP-binding protein
MTIFSQATLFRTVAQLDQLPSDSETEVAFAGRSNAGKSSAINAITNRRRLAFVARQPGKTRMIQMFEVQPGRCLVDLPGYGYAKVDETTRRKWIRLVDQYLRERTKLQGLVLIMDVRHPLTPLDQYLLDWFAPRRLPIHILLTKADKLSRSQAIIALREFKKRMDALGIAYSVQLFSSQTQEGVEEVQKIVAGWLELQVGSTEDSASPNKNPRLKGSKAGGKNALIGIKAPAQGGEAGDDEASSGE